MKFFLEHLKSHSLSRLLNYLIIIFCLIFVIYHLPSSLLYVPNTIQLRHSFSVQELPSITSLEHIVFGLASSEKSWIRRKEYVRLWWRPEIMKGCVFLEQMPQNTSLSEDDEASLPPVYISEDTSRFPYTFKTGLRSAIRVARVVLETVALNHTDVRWFVFGDDDTVFFPENLVKTLSKYDHNLWYYIGTNSESFIQNKFFSFDMAYGGAGFAISYPLAKVLAKVLDSCLERYPHLYGSDARIYSCLSELGITLTHEAGFHQIDVKGNIFGILASHPTRPLVSLHHLEATMPFFPNKTNLESLKHLLEAAKVDPQRILQQTVCYDLLFSITISVAWGYAVQIGGGKTLLPDVLRTQETYRPFVRSNTDHNLDTQRFPAERCSRPAAFFFDSISSGKDEIMTSYKLLDFNCSYGKAVEEVRVFSKKLDLDIKQLQAPRRQCCDVLPSAANGVIDIDIRECGAKELIHMHR